MNDAKDAWRGRVMVKSRFIFVNTELDRHV